MNNSTAGRRSPLGLFRGRPAPRLYDSVLEVLRSRHYSRRTEEAYIHWIRRFILFHSRVHRRELAEGGVDRFLRHLAVKENVASSTQNPAVAALLFLYEHVLVQPLDRMEGVVRARKAKRLPVVLTREEVEAPLARLGGFPRVVCTLLYGLGLRRLEGLQPRVKDLDFGRGEITVRDGKGQKERVTMLPDVLHPSLQDHLRRVRQKHEADLKCGFGRAPLPNALARKYPSADREWRLEVRVPCFVPPPRPKDGRTASSPPARIGHSKGGPSGGPSGRAGQAGRPPTHFVIRLRPFYWRTATTSERPGTLGGQGRADHDGLQAPIESWLSRGPQPA